MADDYYFTAAPEFEKALGDNFTHCKGNGSCNYLITNTRDVAAEIYAHEINFYLNNSQDSFPDKIECIKKLYDCRVLEYSLAQDIEQQKPIGTRILLVTTERESDIERKLKLHGYSVTVIDPSKITGMTGTSENFSVSLAGEDIPGKIEVDRIIWFDLPKELLGVHGIHDPLIFGRKKTIDRFCAKPGFITYKKEIGHETSLCSYQGKGSGACGRCTSVCPTRAISEKSDSRQLKVFHPHCTGCGTCAGICPTGAMEYLKMSASTFERICAYYTGRTPLIIPERLDLDNAHIPLPADVLPLSVANENFLDESHLLSLFLTSGKPIVLFSDTPSSRLWEIQNFLNEIFERKFKKHTFFICETAHELGKTLAELPSIHMESYSFEGGYRHKRHILSRRLAHVVGNDDLGTIATPPMLSFGNITVDQDKCTLCLACIDACLPGALSAHSEDNTLRFTPSLCTACKRCLHTCPEKGCLHITEGILSLHPRSFRDNVVAQDELMECVECKRRFAPKKSIEKIAGIMKPIFAEDPVKTKTLYCCQNCKARIMIESQIADNLHP